MPIYEYRCEPCDHTFETLIRGSGDVAHCPKCGGVELAKQFSVPAAAQTGHASAGSLPVCDAGPSPFGCGGGGCGSGMCAME
jgi:putative FmdB family regulatory protein